MFILSYLFFFSRADTGLEFFVDEVYDLVGLLLTLCVFIDSLSNFLYLS
jgi:hypothetical protein